MKGNNGTGNNPARDGWGTPEKEFGILNNQYHFEFDCCASGDNTKCIIYYTDFQSVGSVNGIAWMNPPFSKAREMFRHFFSVVKNGVAIYRCDNLETYVWQNEILPSASWVFIP